MSALGHLMRSRHRGRGGLGDTGVQRSRVLPAATGPDVFCRSLGLKTSVGTGSYRVKPVLLCGCCSAWPTGLWGTLGLSTWTVVATCTPSAVVAELCRGPCKCAGALVWGYTLHGQQHNSKAGGGGGHGRQ